MSAVEVEQITKFVKDSYISPSYNSTQMLHQELDNILFDDCKYFMSSQLFSNDSPCSNFTLVRKNKVDSFDEFDFLGTTLAILLLVDCRWT